MKCIKYISITLTCDDVEGQRSGGCRYPVSSQYISTSNSSNQDTKYNHDAQFTHGTTSQYRICLYWGYKRWRNIRQQQPHLLSYLTVGVLKTFYVCVGFRMCVHTHIHRLCVMLCVSANMAAWDTVTSREQQQHQYGDISLVCVHCVKMLNCQTAVWGFINATEWCHISVLLYSLSA